MDTLGTLILHCSKYTSSYSYQTTLFNHPSSNLYLAAYPSLPVLGSSWKLKMVDQDQNCESWSLSNFVRCFRCSHLPTLGDALLLSGVTNDVLLLLLLLWVWPGCLREREREVSEGWEVLDYIPLYQVVASLLACQTVCVCVWRTSLCQQLAWSGGWQLYPADTAGREEICVPTFS